MYRFGERHVWTTLDALPEPLHFGFKDLLPALEKRLSASVSAQAQPEVSKPDLLDAIQHADMSGGDQGWVLDDFDTKYLGELTISQIKKYDDVDPWLEFDAGELKGLPEAKARERLTSYRGSAFADRAMTWVKTGLFPPVVIISAPTVSESYLETMVGDGRGRINVAVAFGIKKLPVYKMVWNKPLATS